MTKIEVSGDIDKPRIGLEVAHVANMLPQINEEVYQAETYG